MFRVFDSSNNKEGTNQLIVQPKTKWINPERCPDDEIYKLSVNQTMKDVPKMTYREDVNSGHQDDRRSHKESSLTEKTHHVRKQEIYNSSCKEVTHWDSSHGHILSGLTVVQKINPTS